jgi:outer membrane protein assembly factor BamB
MFLVAGRAGATVLGRASAVRSAPARSAPASGGDTIWDARFDRANNSDLAADLGVSPDGSTVFVTGTSSGKSGVSEYATLAYDAASGAKRWSARLAGPGSNYDTANALVVSPDGSTVFVTGWSAEPLVEVGDYFTVAYDALTGATKWKARYRVRRRYNDIGQVIAVNPSGTMVYVSGASNGSGSHYDYATVAYDASNGHRVWASRYAGPGSTQDFPSAIAVSPNGSIVVVSGASRRPDQLGHDTTIAYDAATGDRLWVARYDPGTRPHVAGVRFTPDGSRVLVAGRRLAQSLDYVTLAYDAVTGAGLWIAMYGGGSGDGAEALSVSPDGSVAYVTGGSGGPQGDSDFGTVAYDVSTGSELWAALFDGPVSGDQDTAFAIGVSPDGTTVMVTGQSYYGPSGTSSYATVAYDAATGDQRWSSLYVGGRFGTAVALGVSPDGLAVFVTGTAGSGADYVTVAYTVK